MVLLIESMMPSGPLGWVKIYSYFFDGYFYDYPFPVGELSMTEKQAEDMAARKGCRKLAEEKFLAEVPLKEVH